MPKRIAMIFLSLAVLVACGPPKYKKQVVEDPLFPGNYIVKDQNGWQIGYATRVSENEYRLFTDTGKVVIIKDPIIKDGYLIFDERGGD